MWDKWRKRSRHFHAKVKKTVFATNNLHQLKIHEKKVNSLTVGSLKCQAFKPCRLLFTFNLASGCKCIFLLRQLWIVNYSVKSSSNNLSNENINTGVSVVYKTRCELKCWKNYFSGNTSFHVFITERIFDGTFGKIIDQSYLT